MKILWLASWYPNPQFPYDGDFVQRHAIALATHIPVTVFYVAQWGNNVNVKADRIIEQQMVGVKENIILFKYKKTGFYLLDKLIYNFKFYRTYKKAIRRYLQEEGKPDIVHVHVPMKAGVIAKWMFNKWGIPYIVSEHSSLYDRSALQNFFKRSYLHRTIVKRIFRNAIATTNVSAFWGDLLKKMFGLQDMRIINNTVNTNFFNYKEAVSPNFRFIHVSTLTYQKNVEGVLKVVARLYQIRQDFEFVIVGPANKNIKTLIDKYGLNSLVQCTGEISYPEVAKHMQQASALVLFSRYENFPCVIIEALCCGLPCIAANVGGVSEAINRNNGLLVPSGNEDELFKAMNDIMNEYDKMSRKMISDNAIKKYNYSAIGKQFLDLYKEILRSD